MRILRGPGGTPSRRHWFAGVALATMALTTVLVAGILGSQIWLHHATATSGSLNFAAPVTYPMAPTPQQILVGDFNGDGHPDLIVTNSFYRFCDA